MEHNDGKAAGSILERYEWDHTFITDTDDSVTPRVLYIGDSISRGIYGLATEEARGEYLFDSFASSKALDNPFFREALSLYARQENNRSMVLFNNGLHGFHLSDEEEYPALYGEMIRFLLREFPHAKIALVLTTAVQDADTNARVTARNGRVLELSRIYGMPVIDLYGPSVRCGAYHSDYIHFSEEGNRILARSLLEGVKSI